MSRSVDLFIDADVPLEELVPELGRLVGSPLDAEPDQARWRLRDGEVVAVLAQHPYGDDGALLFTRYRFALSARVGNDVRPSDTPEAALLRRVARRIQDDKPWPVLLVHDLQYCEQVDSVGPDAGGPDTGGPDPGGPDTGGPDPGPPHIASPEGGQVEAATPAGAPT